MKALRWVLEREASLLDAIIVTGAVATLVAIYTGVLQ